MSDAWEGFYKGVEYEIAAGEIGNICVIFHPTIHDEILIDNLNLKEWAIIGGWDGVHQLAIREIDRALGEGVA